MRGKSPAAVLWCRPPSRPIWNYTARNLKSRRKRIGDITFMPHGRAACQKPRRLNPPLDWNSILLNKSTLTTSVDSFYTLIYDAINKLVSKYNNVNFTLLYDTRILINRKIWFVRKNNYLNSMKHDIFGSKLNSIGISSNLLNLFSSY